MSDDEESPEEKPFAIERAKQGRAVCKKCKQKCLQGELRIAKLMHNPFGSGKMKAWHHIQCLFDVFLKQRKTTKRLEGPDDLDGWDKLEKEEQSDILNRIKECDEFFGVKKPSPGKQKNNKQKENTMDNEVKEKKETDAKPEKGKKSKNQSFKKFRRLVADITNHDSYLDKTNCVKKTFADVFPNNADKDGIVLWCKLLLPGVVKRVYNLQSKQLVKLFSKIFLTDQGEMLKHLEQGDIGETIQKFFEESTKVKPIKKSSLTVKDVDRFLEQLSKLTKEDEQLEHFKEFVSKCTANDLKTAIRLIKGDLRMGAGAKHILEGVHPSAYENYQTSRDIEAVLTHCLTSTAFTSKPVKGQVVLLTPVLPMLAEACKSVDQAIKKCPNGMYSEIKYDGERVQVHKSGSEFKYFSRALKPVMHHKIEHFKDYIPKAFPHANDLILDSEILMVDTKTGKPLPFGTLGKHKKEEFKDASVCLFVFDCIYFNGDSLIKTPLNKRKKILQENMTEIPNHIMFSEMEEIHKKEDLAKMIAKVLKLGLEGLVLKDIKSIYEPGKRHWLKVKKDYLFDGAMADSADLIVLGAWYGTGKKGGMMSVFLMGCYNSQNDTFCTVTKVHTGHDDKTLEKLQTELKMEKISQDPNKVPKWLKCTKTMIPDFVAKDPKSQPVWEITGAEFTRQHDVHTADGISIRFPRVTKIRNDKDWKTATNLEELQKLFKNSKENPDVSLLTKSLDDTAEDVKKGVQKRKIRDEEKAGPSGVKKIKIEHKKEEEKVEMVENQIFKGVKALFRDDLYHDKFKDLRNGFKARGGIILSNDEYEQATHGIHYYSIIRKPSMICLYTIRHMCYEWIRDSIQDDTLKDILNYYVRWDPNPTE